MTESVYLIPGEDDTYRACIAAEPPTEDAVFLVEEGPYPVEYYYKRNDIMGDLIIDGCTCVDREDLLSCLNWEGKCYHRIRMLWDFDSSYIENEKLLDIFNRAYRKLMELLDDEVYWD